MALLRKAATNLLQTNFLNTRPITTTAIQHIKESKFTVE